MKKIKKLFKVFIAIILTLIFLVYIINFVSEKPAICFLRSLTDSSESQVNIGPYKDEIEKVENAGTYDVKVSGYPNTSFTLYKPKKIKKELPLIVYIHGGGWSLGKASYVAPFAKLLASNEFAVANVDYSLAPEYPYPSSTIQIADVVNYLYENSKEFGLDTDNIFIGGNSAGAHLSSQMGLIFTDKNYAKKMGITSKIPKDSLKGLILFNGVYNFNTVGGSNFPFIKKLVWSYTGEENFKNYNKINEMSTVEHISKNYPPTFITVGDADPLEFQTIEFINKLKENKVDYTSLLWTGKNKDLNHDYIYELDKKESEYAYKKVVEFLREHLQ